MTLHAVFFSHFSLIIRSIILVTIFTFFHAIKNFFSDFLNFFSVFFLLFAVNGVASLNFRNRCIYDEDVDWEHDEATLDPDLEVRQGQGQTTHLGLIHGVVGGNPVEHEAGQHVHHEETEGAEEALNAREEAVGGLGAMLSHR